MNRLREKVAIVSGAANGIGKAISELFAEEGAWVLVSDIEDERGNATVQNIREKGGSAEYCHADVSSPAGVARAIEAAAAKTGNIDILCNNAAYMGPGFHDILESTEDEWTKCINITLLGTHYFTRATLPYMVKQKKGSIVNVVSIQALAGMMTSVAYTSTKAALLGYTLSAAYDYGPHNVRVNSLCPGPIQTRISPKPMTRTTSGNVTILCLAVSVIPVKWPTPPSFWPPMKPLTLPELRCLWMEVGLLNSAARVALSGSGSFCASP